MKRKSKTIAFSVLIVFVSGIISHITAGNFTDFYSSLQLPEYAPSPKAFSVIWFIIYILEGIGMGLVWLSPSPKKETACLWFALQLSADFIYPILLVREEWLFISLLWLIMIMALVAKMISAFHSAHPICGALQIPYMLWLLFSAVLNIAVAFMN